MSQLRQLNILRWICFHRADVDEHGWTEIPDSSSIIHYSHPLKNQLYLTFTGNLLVSLANVLDQRQFKVFRVSFGVTYHELKSNACLFRDSRLYNFVPVLYASFNSD